MAETPQTDENRFALRNFQIVDWDTRYDVPDREHRHAIERGVVYLGAHEVAENVEAGASVVFSVLGHEADFMVVHLQPMLDNIFRAEQQSERTALTAFTRQPTSYVSVTEAFGYVSDGYFEDSEEDIGAGLLHYTEDKLKPDILGDTYMSFYPMPRHRGEEHNWYDLSFDERHNLMSTHGNTGRQYAGRIKQVIASLVGLGDYKWGITLFGDNPAGIRDIIYKIRFDEVSSRYGEFGQLYIGRRFPPPNFGAFLAGNGVPMSESGDESHRDAHTHDGSSHHGGDGDGHHHHSDGDGSHPHDDDSGEAVGEDVRGQLEDLNIYAGKLHGEDVYATVLYSETDADGLFKETEGLRDDFSHYLMHVRTAVYEANEHGRVIVTSIWEAASAAETAAGFLSKLPGTVEHVGEGSGFDTMGMFCTVKSEHHSDSIEKFDTVGNLLEEMDGHSDTDLVVSAEDKDGIFIANQWRSQGDAMEFFHSDTFRDTVQWDHDVLADRP